MELRWTRVGLVFGGLWGRRARIVFDVRRAYGADLLPLVKELSHQHQLQLALLTAARSGTADAAAYAAAAPAEGEFDSDEDALGWDGGGWDEIDGPR